MLVHDSEVLIEELNNGHLQLLNNDSVVTTPSTRKPYKKRNSEAKAKKANNSSSNASSQQTKQIVQTITVDANGVPIYPINMGSLSIHNLGQIVYDRPGYHTENWIYPAGFVSSRVYGHVKEPERKCVYTCRILDNGDFPRFEIAPESDSDFIITGPTPDLCHAALIQTINNSTDIRNIDIRPQGEWFFGLAHPTVMTLLQTSPDISKCTNFKSFNVELFSVDKETDPSVNYEALQRHIAISSYHTVLEVKEEPPDELLEQTSEAGSNSFSLP